MRILMVTPYPPVRDGIGAYAVQSVARLRAECHDVEVLSPQPSAAHHHLDLAARRGPLALAKRVPAYDRVIVQYHPDVFFPVASSGWDRVARTAMLALAFRRANDIEVRVHEVDYSQGRGSGPLAQAMRAMWGSVDRISVHTEAERDQMHRCFGVALDKIDLVHHGRDFVPRVGLDRNEARRALGVATEPFLFVCIGFIQPHKGFDRAVDAFARARLADHGCRLAVVGSLRVEEPEYREHFEQLRDLAAVSPGVDMYEGFVSDTDFDRWIVASDTVVLPYRLIWSSSVLERAVLLGRRAIATRVGGLAEQHPEVTVVDDDDSLACAMADAAGGPAISHVSGIEPWPATAASRDEVMDLIRARAAARRGRSAGALAPAPVPSTRANSGGRRPVRPVSKLQAVRRLAPLTAAAPNSTRIGVPTLKRAVQRVTAWYIDPVIAHVNRLQQATADALDSLEPVLDEDRDGGEPGRPGSE
ncbi:MAG: glycosyltransferase family 4 protein [Acidimicrobiia bacterium]|nr:glycosyltransferase family 4 protein [Acidimicrobiia bacterium]